MLKNLFFRSLYSTKIVINLKYKSLYDITFLYKISMAAFLWIRA